MTATLDIHPLTPTRWTDLERLFGERGASSGCWCMWWRKTAKEWERDAGAGNRRGFRALVEAGPPPGLLAYRDGEPVGWVAVAPRTGQVRLQRSPKLAPVDDIPVWAITCFYIHARHRGSGVAKALLAAAVAFARDHGAPAVEGIPIDASRGRRSNAETYTGTLAMFDRSGFAEIERRGDRPIVRKKLRARRPLRT